MKKSFLVFLVSLIFVGGNCFAAGAGTSGAQFLQLGVGARPTAMGEAFVGVADDVHSINWNPAGLSQIDNRQATFMHNQYLVDTAYEYAAYAQPISLDNPSLGVVGIGIAYLNYGEMAHLSASGEDLGTFTASDLGITLSYGAPLPVEMPGKISAGANVKILSSKIEEESASGFALDLACLYKTPVEGLDAGLSIQNIGTTYKFIEEADPLPLTIKLGAGYRLLEDSLLLAMDVNMPNDSEVNVGIGVEYKPINMLAVRVGYNSSSSNVTDLSCGLGFIWEQYGIGIDYAWVPYGDLGQSHRISLVGRF